MERSAVLVDRRVSRRTTVSSALGLVLASIPVSIAWLPLTTESSISDGSPEVTVHRSLIDSEGVSVLIPLLIPVVLAAVPVLMREGRRAQLARVFSAALLGVGVFLAILSVWWFYVPALLAMVMAVRSGSSPPNTRAVQSPLPS
jgi:hypothetical protein